MSDREKKTELVQGTLDMLILKTLSAGPLHGYAIANRIQRASNDFLKVEEGSLYPALHRMERRAWIEAEWGLSETKRKAKYYQLTALGREQLKVQVKNWERIVQAIAGVMGKKGARSSDLGAPSEVWSRSTACCARIGHIPFFGAEA